MRKVFLYLVAIPLYLICKPVTWLAEKGFLFLLDVFAIVDRWSGR